MWVWDGYGDWNAIPTAALQKTVEDKQSMGHDLISIHRRKKMIAHSLRAYISTFLHAPISGYARIYDFNNVALWWLSAWTTLNNSVTERQAGGKRDKTGGRYIVV